MATNIVYSVTGTTLKVFANGAITPQTGIVDLEFASTVSLANNQTISGSLTSELFSVFTDTNIWTTNPTSSGQALTTNSTGGFSWTTPPIATSTTWNPNLRVIYSSGPSSATYGPVIYLQRRGNIVSLTIDLAAMIAAAGPVNYPINLISSNPVLSFDTYGPSGSFLQPGYIPDISFFPQNYGGHYYLGTLPVCSIPVGGGSPVFFNAIVSLYCIDASADTYSLSISPGGYPYALSVPQEFGSNATFQFYLGATGDNTGTGTIDQISSVTYTYYAT